MNIEFMIFELVVRVLAFVTYVGYHLGLRQGRKPASLAALPHLTSAFATTSNSTHRKGVWACSSRPQQPFLSLLKKQKAAYVTKRETDFR